MKTNSLIFTVIKTDSEGKALETYAFCTKDCAEAKALEIGCEIHDEEFISADEFFVYQNNLLTGGFDISLVSILETSLQASATELLRMIEALASAERVCAGPGRIFLGTTTSATARQKDALAHCGGVDIGFETGYISTEDFEDEGDETGLKEYV